MLVTKSEEKKEDADSPSYVLNIDQSWGAGKTFFLERFQKQLENANYLTCYINAWEDDFSEDPMIPIISALDEQIIRKTTNSSNDAQLQAAKDRFTKAIKIVGRHIVHAGLKKAIGISISEISDDLTTEKIAEEVGKISEEVAQNSSAEIIENFRKTRENLNEFKQAFSAIINEVSKTGHQAPIFILVDELDRCKPTYTILLLERIKHLFAVEGAVFVLTTDKEQLAHAISAVYGAKFDSIRYLNRFFDSTYRFPTPSIENFVKFQISSHVIDEEKLSAPFDLDTIDFIIECINAYKLTLRDVKQCLGRLKTITSLWNSSVKIQLVYILPLLFSDHLGDQDEFNALENCDDQAWFDQWKKKGKARKDFNITYTEGNHINYKVKSVSFTELTANFFSYSRNLLNDLPQTGSEAGGARIWLYQLFFREYQIEHHARHTHGQRIISRVRRYPQYVQNAASLSER
nr:P-loop NTPase fold protein [Thalassospira lucentensis]